VVAHEISGGFRGEERGKADFASRNIMKFCQSFNEEQKPQGFAHWQTKSARSIARERAEQAARAEGNTGGQTLSGRGSKAIFMYTYYIKTSSRPLTFDTTSIYTEYQ
jgi:hypothetical protein